MIKVAIRGQDNFAAHSRDDIQQTHAQGRRHRIERDSILMIIDTDLVARQMSRSVERVELRRDHVLAKSETTND